MMKNNLDKTVTILLVCFCIAIAVDAKRDRSRRSYIPAPTYTPDILGAATKTPSLNVHATSTSYEFSTAPADMSEIMNAATKAPHSESDCEPSLTPVMSAQTPPPTIETTEQPTSIPTALPTPEPTAEIPNPTIVSESGSAIFYFSTTPVSFPTSNANTKSPSNVAAGFRFPTSEPTSEAADTPSRLHDDNDCNPTVVPTDRPTIVDLPLSNAQTEIPTSDEAKSAINTGAPSLSLSPTESLSEVFMTVNPSDPLSNAPVPSPSEPGPTYLSPVHLSPVLVLDAETRSPTLNGQLDLSDSNDTALCQSSSGNFFLAGNDSATVSYELDVFTFAYEVETIPTVAAEDVVSSLEIAFVDAILSTLFPIECQTATKLSMRLLQNQYVVGVSSDPADVITDVPCEPQEFDKNNCAIVDGKMSIFTVDGETDETMKDIKEALIEAMDSGSFVDLGLGVVRVSYSSPEIDDESQIDTSNQNENDGNTAVNTNNDQNSSLGLGLSLSAAGLLLIAVGATVYKRKQKIAENDASTLQDGTTVNNGLNRFDASSVDVQSADESARELKILPLSPATRCRVENQFPSENPGDK